MRFAQLQQSNKNNCAQRRPPYRKLARHLPRRSPTRNEIISDSSPSRSITPAPSRHSHDTPRVVRAALVTALGARLTGEREQHWSLRQREQHQVTALGARLTGKLRIAGTRVNRISHALQLRRPSKANARRQRGPRECHGGRDVWAVDPHRNNMVACNAHTCVSRGPIRCAPRTRTQGMHGLLLAQGIPAASSYSSTSCTSPGGYSIAKHPSSSGASFGSRSGDPASALKDTCASEIMLASGHVPAATCPALQASAMTCCSSGKCAIRLPSSAERRTCSLDNVIIPDG